ncbi:phosphotransferase [Streptomyces sp. NPDC002896]|uniref:phosphotransferase n=1 Tax=Streptomyces sp. NPDC002896 TaxID=3154438 RepID=UPI00332E8A61
MGIGVEVANPMAGLERSLSEFFIDADGAAVMHSSMPGRFIAAISSGGVPRYVLKVGRADDRPLRNEAKFLQAIPRTGFPLAVPKFLFAGLVGERYVVVTLAWPNSRPAGLLERKELLEITEVLGMTTVGCDPIVHGDFAPWNVLRTPAGIALVDWERARIADQPLRDLIHYVMQAGAHLRWLDVQTVVRELTHPQGMVAELAQRLNLPHTLVREALCEYFTLAPAARTPRRVSRFRERIAVAAGLPRPGERDTSPRP